MADRPPQNGRLKALQNGHPGGPKMADGDPKMADLAHTKWPMGPQDGRLERPKMAARVTPRWPTWQLDDVRDRDYLQPGDVRMGAHMELK